jgi:hypothetical protein
MENFPEALYHSVKLENMYAILADRFLRPRTTTSVEGAPKGNPDYVYLTTHSYNPFVGYVTLVLDSIILLERTDYLLNIKWSYGPTKYSMQPSELEEFLKLPRALDEIIFEHDISLDKYLQKIVVPQFTDLIIKSSFRT